MPIEVRYGLDGEAAGLAALAGALSRRGGGVGLPAPPSPAIGGGGGGVRSPGMMGTTGPLGSSPPRGQPTMEELLRQQTYAAVKQAEFMLPVELERKRQEAKIAANEWEAQYTGKQRAEIARIQNGIEQARKSGLFDEKEMEQIERQAAAQIAGINPATIPKREEQKQLEAWATEGKGVGTEWVDEWGNVKTREADGTIKTQVSFDKTRDGIQIKLQAEREAKLAETRLKLLTESIPVVDEIGKRTGEEKPRYSPIQVESILEKAFPWYREQRIQQDVEATEQWAAIQQAIPQEQPVVQPEWWRTEHIQKLDVKPQDADLPPQVAEAQAFIRTVDNRYKSGIPGGMKDLIKKYRTAARIIMQYQELGNTQQAPTPEMPQQMTQAEPASSVMQEFNRLPLWP